MSDEMTLERAICITGDRIRELRKLMGMGQLALAQRVGVGQPQVSRWERGDVAVPFVRRAAVATALKADPSLLFRELFHAEMREAAA